MPDRSAKGNGEYVLEKDVSYLFDLDKDPAEETNLASVYPDRVRDMDHAFLVWEKKVARRGECAMTTKFTLGTETTRPSLMNLKTIITATRRCFCPDCLFRKRRQFRTIW